MRYRGYLLFVVLSFLLIFYPKLSLADDIKDINLEPAPTWVIQYDVGSIDDIPTDEVSNGLHYHMVDNQIQVSKTGERTSYSRYVETIVNQSGLDSSSQLNFEFDPSYQKFVLHSLFVIRNGQRLNRLQTAKKTLLNSESELSSQIYSGSLTLNILMSDLQVGDTLDYSYTRFGANPVYQSSFSYQRNLSWSVPLNIQHLRILWGKSTPLIVTPINASPTIYQNNLGEFTEYQITLHKPPVVTSASQIPGWYDAYSSVYFSESEQWSDVVAWAKPLYQFSVHPSVKAVAVDIQSKFQDKSAKIVAALKYTQEQIRYVGLEMGLNSHVPNAPEETLKLKYGDCKDKASLLISILAALDIEAFPVLVDTKNTKRLKDMPPAANHFDHVIVNLNHQGKTIWLDPTLINQTGSLSNLYQPDYGYGLVLKPEENKLTSMSAPSGNSYTHITEKYYIPEEHEKRVTLSVESQHSGENALKFLTRLEKDGKNQVGDSYEIYYQKFYASLSSTDEITVKTDDTKGIVSVNEQYEITEYWKLGDKHYESDYYPTDVRDAAYKPEQIKRNEPLSLAFPNNISNHFELTFESDGWDFEGEVFVEDNAFFVFHKTVSFEENTLKLKFDYQAKQDHVPADQIDDYLLARDRLREEAYFGLLKYIKNENLEQQAEDTSDGENEEQFSVLQIFIAIYVLGILFICVSWGLESRKRPLFEDTHFYPLSGVKFIILSIGTMGLYEIYWAYRNWHTIKSQTSPNIMPIARGIFSPIWFYPLYSALRKDSIQRFDKNKIMPSFIAIIFAVSYLVIYFASSYYENLLFTVLGLLAPLLVMPFVIYINSINIKSGAAYQYNSQWKIRQIVALILCVPLITYTLAIETPFLPGDSVRTESQILDSDLKFLYRKQALPANETIHYFYSDAFLSIRDDGNGFTDNRVFSYWMDDHEGFQLEKASYDQIKNIEVEYANKEDSNTIITIKRTDSSEFMLFVSNVDSGDKLFFNKLNKLWKNTNDTN